MSHVAATVCAFFIMLLSLHAGEGVRYGKGVCWTCDPKTELSSAVRGSPQRQGFSLVELLVVIAIISILATLLLPFISEAFNRAKVVTCASRMRQVHMAASLFNQEYANDMHGQEFFYNSNATGDYPWEGGTFRPYRPGNPAIALYTVTNYLEEEYRTFFCPLYPVDPEVWFAPQPVSGSTMWGTYVWLFGGDRRQEDAEDILMTDTSASGMRSQYGGINYRYEHYNALRKEGGVELIARTGSEYASKIFTP